MALAPPQSASDATTLPGSLRSRSGRHSVSLRSSFVPVQPAGCRSPPDRHSENPRSDPAESFFVRFFSLFVVAVGRRWPLRLAGKESCVSLIELRALAAAAGSCRVFFFFIFTRLNGSMMERCAGDISADASIPLIQPIRCCIQTC